MDNNTLKINFSEFQKVDIRVGIVESVDLITDLKVSAYKLTIAFGEDCRKKKSIAQATNYPVEKLIGKQVLAVVNFEPKQIGKHISEVLVLGVPTKEKGTALVVPDMEAIIGGKLF